MSEKQRRFIPSLSPVGAPQYASPAMRREVLDALHCRRRHLLDNPVEISEVERLLQPRDYGVWSALTALSEYGLVELLPADERYSVGNRVVLTATGRAWKAARPGQTEPWDDKPMQYVYCWNGDIEVGPLSAWAKAWEHAYYAGEPGLEPLLLTWRNRTPGYPVHVDRLTPLNQMEAHDGWITWRVWAAGEQVQVQIDGHA